MPLPSPPLLQEDLQKEVARQFALMADDTWRTLDASGTVEQLEEQVSCWGRLAQRYGK